MQFCTIGCAGKKPEKFIDLLKKNNIKKVIDIRKTTRSTGYYSISEEFTLLPVLYSYGIYDFLELDNDIMYLYITDLIYKQWKSFGRTFEYYKQILDYERYFEKILINMPSPFCIMGTYKDYRKCHRSVLSYYLVKKWYKLIKHL